MRKPILSEPDCRAVDLLLNHACGVAPTSHCDPVSQQRIAAVRRLLANLDKMPPVDPPAGLVQRTMARVERAAGIVVQQQAVLEVRSILN